MEVKEGKLHMMTRVLLPNFFLPSSNILLLSIMMPSLALQLQRKRQL